MIHDNFYYIDLIPKLIEGLTKLQKKFKESSKISELKVNEWNYADFGIKILNDLISTF